MITKWKFVEFLLSQEIDEEAKLPYWENFTQAKSPEHWNLAEYMVFLYEQLVCYKHDQKKYMFVSDSFKEYIDKRYPPGE